MTQTSQRTVARPAKLSDATAKKLAECSQSAASAFALATSDSGNVAMALAVADSIADLRELFDQPEVKARIEALQDTPLGFRTDRDPKLKNHKTGEHNIPYAWPVVRDANIEAVLRGLQIVGNQFNIIAGRFYGTKEGFEYLIPKVPGLSEFRQVLGVPRNQTGGAIVECKATWKIHGKPDSLEVSIPVKTDSYSGADQILGKATRKFLSRCYRQMCGANIPEGDVVEGPQLELQPAGPGASVEQFAKRAEPVEIVTNGTPPKRQATPAPAKVSGDHVSAIQEVMDDRGVEWPQFKDCLRQDMDITHLTPEAIAGFQSLSELPPKVLEFYSADGCTEARRSVDLMLEGRKGV